MDHPVVRDVNLQNIIALGSISISLAGGPASIQPKLPFLQPQDIVEDGAVNGFNALYWRYQLADRLFGRDSELEAILAWAKNGRQNVAVRLITGPGGAGKTRLVAEVARKLKTEGWVAGFLPTQTDETLVVDASGRNGGGIFLALDYPEERPEVVRKLLGRVADEAETPVPIRFLLVSRRNQQAWQEQLPRVGHLLGRQELAAPGPLSGDHAAELAQHVAERLAELLGKSAPSSLSDWRYPDRLK